MENLSWKRLLAMAGFVIIVIGLAYLLYTIFFRPSAPVTTPPGLPSVGGLPQVGPGTPGQISTTPGGLPTTSNPPTSTTPSPTANGDITQSTLLIPDRTAEATTSGSDIIYYLPQDGRFYQTTANGTTSVLTDEVFHDVQSVAWSPTRDTAVLEYPDGSNIVYDFRTKSQVTLPKHWQEFSFSPAGDSLAFKSVGLDRDSRWLGISSTNGTKTQAIEPLGDNGGNVEVSWSPNQQVIATFHDTTAADQQTIYFVGLNGENFKSMTAPGIGFQSEWAPDGQRLLYSVASADNAYRPKLWVADAGGENIGQNRHSLNVNTWADKCAFQTAETLICAVPDSLPEGSALARSTTTSIPDTLYSIDVASGRATLLAIPSAPISASSVLVTNDQRSVFMTDAVTGRIYKIAL